MKIEEVYPETRVYTANILRDQIRSSADEFNINFDVTTRQFISFIKEKNLFLMRYILIISEFLCSMAMKRFSNNLMSNVVVMVHIGVLRPLNENIPAVIYLQFTPNFFNIVYCRGEHRTYL